MGAPLSVAAGAIVPQAAAEQDTLQLTPLFVGSKPTVAMIFGTVPVASTVVVDVVVTDTVTDGTVMVAAADLVVSATDVAITFTVRSLEDGVAGEVYVTLVFICMLRVPAPDAGEMDHVTPGPDGSSLVTEAPIEIVWLPAWRTAVVRDTETMIAEKVMVATPDLEGSATDVAFTVIVRSLGGGGLGAV